MAIPVENFFLDNTTEVTLQTRVQQMIASGILSVRFERGEKLPSTRKLAIKASKLVFISVPFHLWTNGPKSF